MGDPDEFQDVIEEERWPPAFTAVRWAQLNDPHDMRPADDTDDSPPRAR